MNGMLIGKWNQKTLQDNKKPRPDCISGNIKKHSPSKAILDLLVNLVNAAIMLRTLASQRRPYAAQ